MRFELPLFEGIRNRFFLIGKHAEEVNVFYLAFLVDNDPHRNRIELVLLKTESTRAIRFSSVA